MYVLRIICQFYYTKQVPFLVPLYFFVYDLCSFFVLVFPSLVDIGSELKHGTSLADGGEQSSVSFAKVLRDALRKSARGIFGIFLENNSVLVYGQLVLNVK